MKTGVPAKIKVEKNNIVADVQNTDVALKFHVFVCIHLSTLRRKLLRFQACGLADS